MAVSNLIRNRKRFIRECLDEEGGEFIMNGQADGSIRVVDDYDEFCSDPDAKRPKEYRMSLFPTNRRVVAYAARGGFRKDQFVYLPINAIREITFNRASDGKKEYCITEFIAHQNSGYPSIVFKMDATGHVNDIEQYMMVLVGFAKLARVRIRDYTKPNVPKPAPQARPQQNFPPQVAPANQALPVEPPMPQPQPEPQQNRIRIRADNVAQTSTHTIRQDTINQNRQ